jgi:hypothetical protein
VNDRLVDFWTEHRLSFGGIGFLRGRGERCRLRWVKITHQHDFLGRICALLAPYNIDSKQRDWTQQ